jgi:hypothetical protein
MGTIPDMSTRTLRDTIVHAVLAWTMIVIVAAFAWCHFTGAVSSRDYVTTIGDDPEPVHVTEVKVDERIAWAMPTFMSWIAGIVMIMVWTIRSSRDHGSNDQSSST